MSTYLTRHTTRRHAASLGLATLAALGLTAAHPAQAQTVVNGTYSTSADVTDALDLFSSGNQSAGPSPTPAQGASYLFTGGTYSATGLISSALRTSDVAATINSGSFTGSFNSLYLAGSTVTITGGTFTQTDAQYENVQSYATKLSVYGGTFATPSSGTGFYIDNTSTDTFYGDFAPQTITNTGANDLTGTFSGTLADGGPLQTFSYDISQGGTLHLVNSNSTVAPEPSSVAAFAFTSLGAAGLILRARRRKSVA